MVDDGSGTIRFQKWNVEGVPEPSMDELKLFNDANVSEVSKELEEKDKNSKRNIVLRSISNTNEVVNPEVGTLVLLGNDLTVFTKAGWIT